MSSHTVSESVTTREHRGVRFFSYLLIFAVGLRRISELEGSFSIGMALFLFGLFTALYASESRFARRFAWYPRVYFSLQILIVQVLGLFQEYQDIWPLLYAVLGLQAAIRCSRREAIFWGGLFAGSTLVTGIVEFGLLSGIGRAAAVLTVGVIIVVYDVQYAQREDAREESRILLAELQLAHQKLEEYATQAEKLAAARERNRILRELHDSVGQKIFAIQLATESTLLLIGKDDRRAASQLNLLQLQTQGTLDQMRQLIKQWYPHQTTPDDVDSLDSRS